MRSFITFITLCSALSVFSMKPLSAGLKDVTPQEKEIRYRDVYFYYYNKDYFTAISLLQAELKMDRLQTSSKDLSLLLGLLYTGYGLHKKSEEVYRDIFSSASSKKQINAAYFYLARQQYKVGETDAALRNLEKVNVGLLAQGTRNEYLYIKFYLSLIKGDLVGAQNSRLEIDETSSWAHYARFNYGTVLMKSGDTDAGQKLLADVGSDFYDTEELNALRDKANTALGFYFLGRKSPKQAVKLFERVRLEGAFANKAMLGIGWSHSQIGDYESALAPWISLAKRGIHETTVQEGILASAFALQRIGALQQALDNYENAITIYEFVRENINDTVHQIRSGQVTSAVFNGEDYSDNAISERLVGVLRKEQGHLLGKLLQEKDFQYVFKQYRDLRYLDNKIQVWRAQTRQFSGLTFQYGDDKNELVSADRLSEKILSREKELSLLLKDYELAIQDKMVDALEKQNRFVSNYLSQARFAVAQILDAQSVVPQ